MRNRRFNALAGTLLAVCCLSLMLVVAPTQQQGLPESANPAPTVASQPVQAAESSDSSADDGLFHMDPLASYEEGFVLATLAPDVTADQAAAQLADDARLAGSSVSNVSGNLVKMALPEGVSVEEAVNALAGKPAFADAQPNYEYFAAEDVMAAASSPASAQAAQATQAAETAQAAQAAETVQATQAAEGPSVLQIAESPLLATQETLSVPPNDNYYDIQATYLNSIRIAGAWSAMTPPASGSEVVIAVLDQGFDTTHNGGDLSSDVFVAPYNSVTQTEGVPALSGFESHGTHVASVICATTNNATGIAGAAYNMCKVMPIKVADSQGKMYSDGLVNAYDYIIQKKEAGVNVRLANVSLGSPRANQSYNDLDRSLYSKIHTAEEAGLLTIAAACNTDDDFTEAPFYAFPSDFDNVISVIGLKRAGTRYESSNYNMPDQHAKNISAPATGFGQDSTGAEAGIVVLGAKSQGEAGYRQAYGTSLATPYVTTAAALMLTANPSLTTAQVTSKLYSSADDISSYGEGWDAQTGYGRLNASAAVASTTPYIDGPTVTYSGTAATYKVLVNGEEKSAYKFTSSDPEIAEVTADGNLTPKSAGVVTITAKSSNKRAIQSVTVYDNLANAKIEGDDTVLAGTSSSYVVDASPQFTWLWSSSDASVPIQRNTGLLSPSNLAAGPDKTVTITAALISDPNVKATKDITITSNDISEGNPHVTAETTSVTYNGRAQSPSVTVKYDGSALKKGTDYTIESLPSETDAGTYSFTVKGAGAYTGERTLTFTIDKASINIASIRLSATSFVYDGKAKAPSVAVYDIGNNASTALGNGVDYTVITSPATLGTGKVVVTATDACKNFTGSATRTFTVDARRVSMFRLYNANSGEHFYTASTNERDFLSGIGWKYEGVGWTAPHSSSAPVYRMYNANAGDHHYTQSAAERDSLIRVGWNYEGIGWYSDTLKRTPLYREYNPNAVAGSHNYTTSISEHRFLCSIGWSGEGIGWYGL